MNRKKLAEDAYLGMIEGQTKIIDALTEELKGTNSVLSHVIDQHGKMRDAANGRGEEIIKLQGRIAGYENTRRVEWLKLFLVVCIGCFAAIMLTIGALYLIGLIH